MPFCGYDPHLGPAIPPPWYLAHLRTPRWEIGGASFVGGPAFPKGFNGHVAWGITAGCTDWTYGIDGGDPIVQRVTRNVLERLSS